MGTICGSSASQEDLNKIGAQITQPLPNTFEYHYITYWKGNNKLHLIHHLEQAYLFIIPNYSLKWVKDVPLTFVNDVD